MNAHGHDSSEGGLREPLHQPPDPADLRAAPPACRECALIRGRLRDFADGDLDPVAAGVVEQHVHGCRSCALALARAEHEVLRLRRAFAAIGKREGDRTRPPSDFAARVRQRLVLDETSLVTTEELAAARGHAERQGAAAGQFLLPAGRARRSGWRKAGFLKSGPGGLALASLVLLLSLLVGIVFSEASERHPEGSGRLVLIAATETWGGVGGQRALLASGDGVGDHQSLFVGPNGAARADWHDASAKNQPAATLRVQGNGSMKVEDGSVMLMGGAVQIETRRPVSIPVADGSRLDLGVGEYHLAAHALPGGKEAWNPLAGAPRDLRVRVEVVRGEAAFVVRGAQPHTLVPVGATGSYTGGSPVDVQAGTGPGSDPGSVAARRPDPITPESPREVLVTGQVFERSGAPAVGAGVSLSFASRGAGRSGEAYVHPDGRFALSTGLAGAPGTCDTPFAIAQVVPSGLRPGFGLTAPDAYRLVYQDGDARFVGAFVLDLAPDLRGTVRDDLGQPRGGVQAVPCIIDELFGTVLPWPQAQTLSDAAGGLRLARLPAALPRHQHLAVLLLHADLETTLVALPLPSSNAARLFRGPFVAPRRRGLALHGLPVSSAVVIYQDVEGLPAGAASSMHTVTTDANGRATLLAGPGRLWLRNTSPSHPMLKELVLGEHLGQPSYAPAGAPRPFLQVFQPQQTLPGTNVGVAGSFRHQRFRTAAAAQAGGDLLFVDDQASGQALQDVQVFAAKSVGWRGPAAVRFLGFTSAGGSLAFELEDGEAGLLAIGRDGSIGWHDGQLLGGGERRLSLAGNGEVLLGAALRPEPDAADAVVAIRFEMAAPPLPGVGWHAYRFTSALDGWLVGSLPPGEYRAIVDGRAFAIEVPSSGVVVLQ